MNKADIRRHIKARKLLLSESEKADAAAQVLEHLESVEAFAAAKDLLVYHSLPDELSTDGLIGKWHASKRLYLPRVAGDDLEILPYDSDNLQEGAFRISEPTGDNITDPCKIDTVIIPAVAYDRHGNRVGRGKGYYDRLLGRMPDAVKIGICYDFQIVDEIDSEPHDIKVDIIITERRIIFTSTL